MRRGDYTGRHAPETWEGGQEKMRSNNANSLISPKLLLILCLSVVAIRLATLGSYPLTDNTEARYAEVSQEMLSSGNWITLQLHGEKFWSKPPLAIWAASASMALLGIRESAARLPSFLFSMFILMIEFDLARRRGGRIFAWAACMVLLSSALFFISSGALMTDAALTLGTTLSMGAFWLTVQDAEKSGGLKAHLFFVGLAIGLLAKGPVALVLTFLPIVFWATWKRRWRHTWTRMPWISGLFLTTLLTLPWYIAAERSTPGFLRYFFIGEHWNRYIYSGWAGDLYGSAHNQPRGMIWLFWIAAAFPWSIPACGALFGRKRIRHSLQGLRHADDWSAYFLAWTLTPMIFFTLAGNILWTYVLPGLPAFALLTASRIAPLQASARSSGDPRPLGAFWISAGCLVPATFALLVAIWHFVPYKNSQIDLVAAFRCQRSSQHSHLVYLFNRPYSAEFYSASKAIEASSLGEFESFFQDSVQDFFAVSKVHLFQVPLDYTSRLATVGSYDNFILFREKSAVSQSSPSIAQPLPDGHRQGEVQSTRG
jgi:4-amino-4-deoxy-L-arabinose transferase-like glycosyltransferase